MDDLYICQHEDTLCCSYGSCCIAADYCTHVACIPCRLLHVIDYVLVVCLHEEVVIEALRYCLVACIYVDWTQSLAMICIDYLYLIIDNMSAGVE